VTPGSCAPERTVTRPYTSPLYELASPAQRADAERLALGGTLTEVADRHTLCGWVWSDSRQAPHWVTCIADVWSCPCACRKYLGRSKHCRHTIALSIGWASDAMLAGGELP
jgi:hypothetical protein